MKRILWIVFEEVFNRAVFLRIFIAAIYVAIVVTLLMASDSYSKSLSSRCTLREVTVEIEADYNLPNGLLHALIQVESAGEQNAFVKRDGVGGKSSHGLTQIQIASARLVGFKGHTAELMRPYTNMVYGAKYLKFLLDRYEGDVATTMTCYNTGMYAFGCKERKNGKYASKILNSLVKTLQLDRQCQESH